jgi:hypothetical protein
MDGMLSKIQKLLSSPKTDVLDNSKEYTDGFNNSIPDSILDIKLDGKDEHKVEEKATKIDFGRMESLLNGLNK